MFVINKMTTAPHMKLCYPIKKTQTTTIMMVYPIYA